MTLRPASALGAKGWALAFMVFTLGAQWLPGVTHHWQFARPSYLAGAWWELITAQWVHLGAVHAAVNALGMAVLLLAFQGLVAGRLQACALLGGYAGVALVLALDPACTDYAGASGALHGLLAGSAVALWAHPPPQALSRTRLRVVAGLVLLGLVAKLLVQRLGAGPTTVGWLGFATYYPAHEAGALGGLAAVLLARLFSQLRSARPGANA